MRTTGGQPFVLLLDSSTFRSPGGGKENELWSNHQAKLKGNGQKEISFPPPGDSKSAKTCFCWTGQKTSKHKISNGHNRGAIRSYTAVSTTPGTTRTSSCSGEGSQGAWGGLGLWEDVESVYLVSLVFLTCLTKQWENNTKFVRLLGLR